MNGTVASCGEQVFLSPKLVNILHSVCRHITFYRFVLKEEFNLTDIFDGIQIWCFSLPNTCFFKNLSERVSLHFKVKNDKTSTALDEFLLTGR